MAENKKSVKNVIIFGETGVGKSSVVNMLLGRYAAKVSDSAVGCTFQHEAYVTKDYVFYDTAGLSEGSNGTVDISTSISQLVKLLKSFSEDGIHLLVFVIKKGRITKSIEDNYELFVNTICDKEVPVILAITHCEGEKEEGKWWSDNKDHFVDRYKMAKIAEALSICASPGDSSMMFAYADILNKRFHESKSKLWDSIKRNALSEGWKMKSLLEWFINVIKKFWNICCKYFNWPRASLWPELQKQFINWGMSVHEATDLSNEIYDLKI